VKPLCIDLFCGLGGWAEGFLSEGYDVIGFDIERHDYGTGGYPGQLVLQDVLTLDGRQFRGAAVIVASPPCQAYSYMAMPWSRAKALAKEREADVRLQLQLNCLFNACFRIAHEAGVPLVVENVKGAQRWVGAARWKFGSYFLWGDVPALMPRVKVRDAMKVGDVGWRRDGKGADNHCFQGRALEHLKSVQDGLGGYGGSFGWNNTPMRRGNSKGANRKTASAQIAKIPFPLSSHIARVFKP
jgi:site-specific DNA-cytosine methylase